MTVTTKQIETIKSQLDFLCLMQNCGKLDDASSTLSNITFLMEQIFEVDVVRILRRDLLKQLDFIFNELDILNEGHQEIFGERQRNRLGA